MSSTEHGALMDQVYRRQRHFYDATRKYFLFGRDQLIEELSPAPGDKVLEMGCGTGRNLVLAAERYPAAQFYGFDISKQMLETSAAKIAKHGLADRITVTEADATRFSAPESFGVEGFDRVYFSYTLSMVPDWRAALDRALEATKPGGRLLITDFGQQRDLPGWSRKLLRGWLALFHVDPQAEMFDAVHEAAARHGNRQVRFTSRYRDYCWFFDLGPTDQAR